MSNSSSRYDLAIAGAGIFGLSIAYAAIKAGLKVIVLDANHVGAGASGGLLGALMPHMPARWNPKKEFQFQALSSLSGHIKELEAATGISCGYRRLGRILPLTTKDKLEHHLERAEESKQRWHPEDTGFSYVVEPQGSRSDWLNPSAAPFGIVFETLAARTAPRLYLKALAAYVSSNGTLGEGVGVTGFDEATECLHLADGSALQASQFVIAGGYSAFNLIETMTGESIGRGEKGQALLLDGHGLEERPAIYCDGLYVVPHADGSVAIGSTSDRTSQDTNVDPEKTADLVQRATAFCPSLKGRQIVTEWAGIRPRCNKRDPLAGLLPGYSRTFVATGGYKISYGIAHSIADALVAEMLEKEVSVALPATFQPDHHFGVHRLDAD